MLQSMDSKDIKTESMYIRVQESYHCGLYNLQPASSEILVNAFWQPYSIAKPSTDVSVLQADDFACFWKLSSSSYPIEGQ